MAKFLGSGRFFCLISICKLGSFKSPSATITSLFELYFRYRRFILLVQTKKVNYELWTMAKAQAAENHGDEWGLTWYLRWEIYTSRPTWTHSQNSLATAKAPSLRYLPMEYLSNDHEDHTYQHESNHELCDETGHPVLSLIESQLKLRKQYARISQWREIHCRTNTSVRR